MTFNTRPFIWGFQANCFTISFRLRGVHASAARPKRRARRAPRGACCFVLSELNGTTSAGSAAPPSVTASHSQTPPSSLYRGKCVRNGRRCVTLVRTAAATDHIITFNASLALYCFLSLKDNCRRRRMGEWWKSARMFGAGTCWEPGTSRAGCSPPCHKFPGF